MPFFLPNAYSFSSNHSHEEKKNRFMYLVAVFFPKADLQLEAHFPYVAVAITTLLHLQKIVSGLPNLQVKSTSIREKWTLVFPSKT